MPKFKIILVTLVSSTLMLGCQSMGGKKEDIGAKAGVVLCGALGMILGDSPKSKFFGGLAGAAICGFIGDKIVKYLDEQDAKRLALETKNTLSSGKSSSWVNPDTGVKGEVKVKETTTSTAKTQIKVLKDRVSELPPLDMRNTGIYKVKKGSNVRGGPSTDYKIVEKLASGSNINVLGKVENSSWYLIGDGDVAKGFVYKTLLESTGQPLATASNSSASDLAVSSVDVNTTINCRTIEQKVTLKNGETVVDSISACQQPDGSWA